MRKTYTEANLHSSIQLRNIPQQWKYMTTSDHMLASTQISRKVMTHFDANRQNSWNDSLKSFLCFTKQISSLELTYATRVILSPLHQTYQLFVSNVYHSNYKIRPTVRGKCNNLWFPYSGSIFRGTTSSFNNEELHCWVK